MDADAHQVYFDERAVKNAAANIILYSPAVLQVTVTDMIQDDTKTFFDIFDYVKDTCRRFGQLPNKKKKIGISYGQRRHQANIGLQAGSDCDSDSDSSEQLADEVNIGLAPAVAHENSRRILPPPKNLMNHQLSTKLTKCSCHSVFNHAFEIFNQLLLPVKNYF